MSNYIVQNNYMALIHADEASTMNEEDALIGGEFFYSCLIQCIYCTHTYKQ